MWYSMCIYYHLCSLLMQPTVPQADAARSEVTDGWWGSIPHYSLGLRVVTWELLTTCAQELWRVRSWVAPPFLHSRLSMREGQRCRKSEV